jgi:hypothetical protein
LLSCIFDFLLHLAMNRFLASSSSFS